MAKWIIDAELPFGSLTVTKDGVVEPHVKSVEIICDINSKPAIPKLIIKYENINPKVPQEMTYLVGANPEFFGQVDNTVTSMLDSREFVKKIHIETEGSIDTTHVSIDGQEEKLVQSIHLKATLNENTEFEIARYLIKQEG